MAYICYKIDTQLIGKQQKPTVNIYRYLAKNKYLQISKATSEIQIEQGSKVLVAGGSGGAGCQVVRKLLQKGYKVKVLCRDLQKAKQILQEAYDKVEIHSVDLRRKELIAKHTQDTQVVVSAIGTSALPSVRWGDNSTPEQIDKIAFQALLESCPKTVKRFVMMSSTGVDRMDKLPFTILNIAGVLKYKKISEDFLKASQIPYTIFRYGQLIDGPYTGTDLATLLQISNKKFGVQLSSKDDLIGQTSRKYAAEAIVQCLQIPSTTNKAYTLINVEGEDPSGSEQKWKKLFESV